MDNRYTPTTDEVRGAWIALTQAPESFDRWLIAERKRVAELAQSRARAEAWEEGITAFDQAIIKDVDDPWSQLPDNPYRQGETE